MNIKTEDVETESCSVPISCCCLAPICLDYLLHCINCLTSQPWRTLLGGDRCNILNLENWQPFSNKLEGKEKIIFNRYRLRYSLFLILCQPGQQGSIFEIRKWLYLSIWAKIETSMRLHDCEAIVIEIWKCLRLFFIFRYSF